MAEDPDVSGSRTSHSRGPEDVSSLVHTALLRAASAATTLGSGTVGTGSDDVRDDRMTHREIDVDGFLHGRLSSIALDLSNRPCVQVLF